MEEKGNRKPMSIKKLWFLIALAFVALLISTYIKIFHVETFGERWESDTTFLDLFLDPNTHPKVVIIFGVVLLAGVIVSVIWNHWRKD